MAQAPSASPWQSELGHRSVRSLAAILAPVCSLTTLCTQVVGVELVEPAVVDARANATANGIANARFICSRAAHAMKELVAAASAEMGRIGRESGAVTRLVAIVDPPRAGLMPDTIKYGQVDACRCSLQLTLTPRTTTHTNRRALRTCHELQTLVYVSCNPVGSFARDAVMYDHVFVCVSVAVNNPCSSCDSCCLRCLPALSLHRQAHRSTDIQGPWWPSWAPLQAGAGCPCGSLPTHQAH